ncbi:MAG: hypothetical protein ABW360_05045, partial [Phenylobacterium sp.]
MTTKCKPSGTALARRTVLTAAAAAVGLAALPAPAPASAPALVDLQVVDRESGEVARIWRHAGRLYVAGRPGARYGLRVTNNTGGRMLVVMSVDGVNILTGETAGHGQRGYVFDPYETYEVTGWRKSDSEVAAFTFTALRRSYAARTGRPQDVGVIGLAAFTERYAPPPPPPPLAVSPSAAPESRSRAAEALDEAAVTARRAPPSVGAPRPSEKLGTGHGRREWSQVTTVGFERASPYPQFVSSIEYDSYENLAARGVIP